MPHTPESETGTAVIVGSRGFLGRALAGRLRQAGVSVAGFDKGELTADAFGMIGQARTVFWAASSINPAIAAGNPERVTEDRHLLVDFLDEFTAQADPARLVFFSSGGTVYGAGTPPFSENSPTQPTTAYGQAKLALEHIIRERLPNSVSVRIANAYGPGQIPAPGQGVIGHWLQAAATNQPIKVIGDLDTARDYLYIDDLTEALLKIHRSGPLPPVLNLGANTPITLRQVLRAVEKATSGKTLEVEQIPARSFDLPDVWLDSSLAEQTLRWHPKVDLDTGVAKAWEWFQWRNRKASAMPLL